MAHIGFQKRESLMFTGVVNLIRRDEFSNSYWDNAGGARWAFFAIFVILIIIVLLGTLRVNKKRARQGLQPVYGTRWMTPPSYGQSQHQYDQPDHRRDPDLPSAYVPTYTATANEYDMGYYDANGVFHANPNAKSPIPQPPKVHQRSESTTVTDENAHTQGGVPITSTLPNDLPGNQHVDDNDSIGDFYRPPQGPPPNRNTPSSSSPENTNDNTEINQNHTSNVATESMPGSFLRPAGPPPPPPQSQSQNGNEEELIDNPIPSSSTTTTTTTTTTTSNGDSLPKYSEGSNPPIVKEKN